MTRFNLSQDLINVVQNVHKEHLDKNIRKLAQEALDNYEIYGREEPVLEWVHRYVRRSKDAVLADAVKQQAELIIREEKRGENLNEVVQTKVVAVHPDWDKSESHGVHITDVQNHGDFESRWTKEPHRVQNEFGYDLPLHGKNFAGVPMPKKQLKMTYKQYVKCVDDYSKNEGNPQNKKHSVKEAVKKKGEWKPQEKHLEVLDDYMWSRGHGGDDSDGHKGLKAAFPKLNLKQRQIAIKKWKKEMVASKGTGPGGHDWYSQQIEDVDTWKQAVEKAGASKFKIHDDGNIVSINEHGDIVGTWDNESKKGNVVDEAKVPYTTYLTTVYNKKIKQQKAAKETGKLGPCMWFAGCKNPATRTTPHPILGKVPTCEKCHKFATEENTVEGEELNEGRMSELHAATKEVAPAEHDSYSIEHSNKNHIVVGSEGKTAARYHVFKNNSNLTHVGSFKTLEQAMSKVK